MTGKAAVTNRRAGCNPAPLLPLIAVAALAGGTELPAPASTRAFLEANCVACHKGAKAPAGIDLAALGFNLADPQTLRQWVRVHDAVEKGQMPPGGLKAASRKPFLTSLAKPLIAHEQRRAATHGRAVLRRLNRYEYENTVRDVLSAPWLLLKDGLPEDGLSERFNKSGQALEVSHVQMARYMDSAEHALRLLMQAAKQPSVTKRYYARDQKRLIRRMKYDDFNRHPERASIPILGFETQPEVIAETAPMTDPKNRELEGFATPAGTYIGNEYHFDEFSAPAGGTYKLRFHTFSIWLGTVFHTRKDGHGWWRPDRKTSSRGRTVEPLTIYAYKAGEKRLLGSFDVDPEPRVHEMTVHLLPGEQILPDAARLFRSRPGFRGSPEATKDGMPGVAYRWMEVTGPIGTEESKATYRRLFGESGERDPEPLLRRFMQTAYRRPPREDEVQRYLGIIQSRLAAKSNPDFTEAMIAGYVGVLCSPGFLYLEEEPGPLNGLALASRLSYFLWNGPPDGELRKLAASGALTRPEVLRAQTERLLDDARSRSFTDAFLDYWLDLRKLNDTTPDQTLYPDYYLDDLLTESAQNETRLFFEYLLKKNLPARNIVDSDFSILNAHLARHYGLPPVEGVAMRYTKLPPESMRGGLLTQASVLKVTANGTTTSPVLRGVWVMERILGDPPPPPPPNLPAVEPDTRGATTIRQQLDKHRSVPSCAACHVKIDPPGFALESFDVLGGWRDRYRSTEEGEPVEGLGKNGHVFTFRKGQPVDASGQLPSGETFRDVTEFRRLLVKNERQVARNMVNQFVAYGTGAPVSFADRVEVGRILDAAAKHEYRMRTIIHGVVQSRMFRNK